MKINFSSNGTPPESWRPVTLGDESFEVLVRQPTFNQKMVDWGLVIYSQDDDASTRRAVHRLTSAIVDWRGLERDDEHGAAIPFDNENLQSLCSHFPEVADQLFLYAHRAFEGTLLTEEQVKNSGKPSGDIVADGEGKTTKQATVSVITPT